MNKDAYSSRREREAQCAPPQQCIHVLIVDPHALLVDTIAAYLNNQPDLRVTTAPSFSEARRVVDFSSVDVLLAAPHTVGSGCTDPAPGGRQERASLKVILLSGNHNIRDARRALAKGAQGLVHTRDTPETLTDAIRFVYRGNRWFSPSLPLDEIQEADPLTPRLKTVLKLVDRGLTDREIARELNLSHGTVRNYVHEALGRLQAKNRTHAVNKARKQGWI